ncbi:unnamed protein product [Eruca vesicaria subsp. sativa]|uniref:Uncharacterized protein n=1 Tax=Eruca vesicaria subsp. sativa TaxID=29727 RepID=A0ABC8JQ93_ERUVS|nr:unnamed protein product [Eruca vesicaria subsp. sativa]
MNGLMGIVSKKLVYSDVLAARTQCILKAWCAKAPRLGESFCPCWRHSLGSSRNHSTAGGSYSTEANINFHWFIG